MTSSTKASPRSGANSARKVLYWLAIAVAVAIAAINTVPYIRAVQFVFDEIFTIQGFVWAFVANNALTLVAVLLGIVLWAFIQTAEVYPILLKHDRRLMRLIALEADSADQLEVRDTDDPALASLKDWYNRFPLLSIRSANRVSLVSYVVDTTICLSVFPPVEGGFGQLVFVLVTAQWNLIDWGAVALIVVMLFCFEAMVRLVLFLGLQAYYLRRAHG
jgi:hypothetical protein